MHILVNEDPIIQAIIMAAKGKPRQYLTGSLNFRTDLCVCILLFSIKNQIYGIITSLQLQGL